MPYITFSRKSKAAGKAQLEAATRLSSMLSRARVRYRGNVGVRYLASLAASDGFCRVVVLKGSAPIEADVLKVSRLGKACSWGRKYLLDVTAEGLAIKRDGKDAEAAFKHEAQD